MFILLCVCLYMIACAYAADRNNHAIHENNIPLMEVLRRMDIIETKHVTETAMLTNKFMIMDRAYNKRIKELTDRLTISEDTIVLINEKLEDITTKQIVESDRYTSMMKNFEDTHANASTRFLKRDIGFENIAFTSYLDHDLVGVGTDQTLVFNQILLNDGNGYNKHTGAFVAPVPGVYHFDFFIGERDVNQMYAWLVVNDDNQVDSVAESIQSQHDVQSGNSANLRLELGDTVLIKHRRATYGNHVEGSDDVRISTFSGFLLYSVENTAIIG